MTEQEWLACTDATQMLGLFLEQQWETIRIAWCSPDLQRLRKSIIRAEQADGWRRRFWEVDREGSLTVVDRDLSERKMRLFVCACCRCVWQTLDDKYRTAIEIAERYADGYASSQELQDCWWMTYSIREPYIFDELSATYLALKAARQPVEWIATTLIEPARQSQLLRDIIGNPFHPVSLDPTWLTSTAVSLAQAIYEDRAFDRLPILGDALEDAGCTSADILNHCRQPGEHVRGCWVVDLVLGKE